MLIRVEIPLDAQGIDQLLRQCFATPAEAQLVSQLREEGLLTLGMVAITEVYPPHVVGYIAFSPVMVAGEDRHWVGLAPVAVAPEYRRQGIAESLIREGLNTLNEFGYSAVVVLGDSYYARFGFITGASQGFYCRWPNTEQAFQVYGLLAGELAACSGLVAFSAPFERVD